MPNLILLANYKSTQKISRHLAYTVEQLSEEQWKSIQARQWRPMKNHYNIKSILIPLRIIKDFEPVRKMIQAALKSQPKTITYEEALKQVQKFKEMKISVIGKHPIPLSELAKRPPDAFRQFIESEQQKNRWEEIEIRKKALIK